MLTDVILEEFEVYQGRSFVFSLKNRNTANIIGFFQAQEESEVRSWKEALETVYNSHFQEIDLSHELVPDDFDLVFKGSLLKELFLRGT